MLDINVATHVTYKRCCGRGDTDSRGKDAVLAVPSKKYCGAGVQKTRKPPPTPLNTVNPNDIHS